jgi:sulfoxide reductase heme-binding subunit YedZ
MFGPKRLSWLQPAIVFGSAIPFAVILVRAAMGSLGANPIATVLNQLGLLALAFLVASLLCTPLKIVLGWTWPARLRRTLGLFAFGAASAHFLTYIVLDQMLEIRALIADVTKRPFILVGLLALLAMLPLAVTSTKDSVQRMGFKRWKRLHRLAYLAVVLGVVHFFMRVKASVVEPVTYGAVVTLLFSIRLVDAFRKLSKKKRRIANQLPG